MLKQSIDSELKQAMLAGDKVLATTLRTIKSVILNAEVSAGKRDVGLSDEEIIGLLMKENKKRIEASKIYKDAGDEERAEKELVESKVIEKYLPQMMSEEEIKAVVVEIINSMQDVSMQQMGQVIGAVKAKAGSQADGGLIAKVVNEQLAGK